MTLPRALAVAALALTLAAAPAGAATIGISSAGAMNGNAFATLSQLGADGAVVGQGASLALGSNLAVSFGNANSLLTRVDQGATWGGNFSPGQAALWSGGFDQSQNILAGGAMTLTFSRGIRGVGAQIQRNLFGNFVATIRAYGANGLLGSYSVNAYSGGAADGAAAFLGIYDPTGSNTSVAFDVAGGDFAIGGPIVQTAVPEPATLSLLGLGLALGARTLRRKANNA